MSKIETDRTTVIEGEVATMRFELAGPSYPVLKYDWTPNPSENLGKEASMTSLGPDLSRFVGKKVRVTVEALDE